MSLTTGKRETDRIVAILNEEHPSKPVRASALLKEMEAILAERAKFVVVGQLQESQGRAIDPSDPEAVRVALGWYSTESEAQRAAESLWAGRTGETFRVWVLPCHHGTPQDFHNSRKDLLIAQQEKAKAAQGEKIQAQIERRRAQIEERARRDRGEVA